MIKWNITMGLYWVRPYTFINLDSTNRAFITEGFLLYECADLGIEKDINLSIDVFLPCD